MSHIRNQILLDKIGRRLKSLREKKELTQENVFNDTGIHIGRIETATTNVTVSTIDALCKYYNIELDAFFRSL
ncbi:MAG TPA: helix-turn-helix transcriptional regulator [Chryseosolibacter sp.]